MRCRSPRRGRALARTALVFGVLALPSPARAEEWPDRSFSGGAEASGIYIRYGIPGFLAVEDFLDGGGPVAQAAFNADGTSQSFASWPYPGGTLVNYPGLAAVALGSAPPGYPLYASASYPTQPEQKVNDPSGTYRLSAAADDRDSASEAVASVPQDSEEAPVVTRAQTRVGVVDSVVSASAVSLTRGFAVGPLSIAVVKSTAVTTYRNGTDRSLTETTFVIEGGRAGDLSFSFGPGGLEVADQGGPVPTGEGVSRLNSALAPAGLSVAFRDSRDMEGGAAAAALEVVSAAEVPGAGKGTLRIRLGGAQSWIRLGSGGQSPPAPASAA